jgi:hypothetical protein
MNATLAALRTAIKGCSRFYIHADRDPTVPTYSDAATFTVSCVRMVYGKRGAQNREVIAKVEVPGRITHGYTSRFEMRQYEGRSYPKYCDAYRPTGGYASLQDDSFRSAVLSIPARCEPRFLVYLDAGTTENHVKLGIHSDYVYLNAYDASKGDTLRTFLIDVDSGPHNTARFGSPKHDNDQGELADWIERRDRETAEYRGSKAEG